MFEDWLAIQNLIARYAELLNTGQFDEVGELFKHGTVKVDGNPKQATGSVEVAAMYRESVRIPEEGPDSLLYTTNTQIEFEGETARARSYFAALHSKGAGVIVPVVGGRYRDTFRKRADGWCFEERRMSIDLIGDLGDHITGPIEDYLTGD
jgi:ketosteroid isomerase-like protein